MLTSCKATRDPGAFAKNAPISERRLPSAHVHGRQRGPASRARDQRWRTKSLSEARSWEARKRVRKQSPRQAVDARRAWGRSLGPPRSGSPPTLPRTSPRREDPRTAKTSAQLWETQGTPLQPQGTLLPWWPTPGTAGPAGAHSSRRG